MAYKTADSLGRVRESIEPGLRYAHERLRQIEWTEWLFWLVAVVFSAGMATWLAIVFHSTPFVPGGDPGNWVATSYIYVGRPYPSQLTPLGYPPLLFPVLGVFVLAFGPVGGTQLFAPTLYFALALSGYWLARHLLRTKVMALLAVTFLLIDPPLLDMFYWGAYPNLFAFVFMNLAWVGVIRAGRGHPSSGAFQYWLFFAATILTHSLVGLALSLGAALFIGFAALTGTTGRATTGQQAQHGTRESPSLAAHALIQSRGGLAGLLLVLLGVGGYYGGTYAVGIPHPDYFLSSTGEFVLIPYGTIFQAIVPHIFFSRAVAFDLLLLAVVFALAAFALMRDRRPQWLTPSMLLLLSWLLSPVLLAIGGVLLQIITDYHRFGFLLLTPLALTAAYMWETVWVLRPGRMRLAGPAAPSGPSVPAPRTSWLRGGGLRSGPMRRPALMALGGVAAVIVLLVSTTAPAMVKSDAAFTRVGHDASFLDAVNAIRHSGIRGGTLTVAGAEKWTRALTSQNAYAPSSPLYLFYPSQATDAQLAYYALVSHYALTNGKVTAALHAANPIDAEGLPDYSVSVSGPVHPVLRVMPQSVVVQLAQPGTGRLVDERLNGTPAVSLPASSGQPMTVQYTEQGFTLIVSISVDAVAPLVNVAYSATTTGPYTLRSLALTIAPEAGTRATVTGSGGSGGFDWQLLGGAVRPVTSGTVSPPSALVSATEYDPSAGGPAVQIVYRSADPAGGSSLYGSLTLNTPTAASYVAGIPPVLSAPAIWSELGVRFVLMRNASFAQNPIVALPGEVDYLVREYGLPILYASPEWTVLLIPPTLT